MWTTHVVHIVGVYTIEIHTRLQPADALLLRPEWVSAIMVCPMWTTLVVHIVGVYTIEIHARLKSHDREVHSNLPPHNRLHSLSIVLAQFSPIGTLEPVLVCYMRQILVALNHVVVEVLVILEVESTILGNTTPFPMPMQHIEVQALQHMLF